MRTIKVIGGGLLLLAAFPLAGRTFGDAHSGALRSAARYFISVWFGRWNQYVDWRHSRKLHRS